MARVPQVVAVLSDRYDLAQNGCGEGWFVPPGVSVAVTRGLCWVVELGRFLYPSASVAGACGS